MDILVLIIELLTALFFILLILYNKTNLELKINQRKLIKNYKDTIEKIAEHFSSTCDYIGTVHSLLESQYNKIKDEVEFDKFIQKTDLIGYTFNSKEGIVLELNRIKLILKKIKTIKNETEIELINLNLENNKNVKSLKDCYLKMENILNNDLNKKIDYVGKTVDQMVDFFNKYFEYKDDLSNFILNNKKYHLKQIYQI